MRIAIIGTGWVGCHVASTLVGHHDIALFSNTNEVFAATSAHNQNRLHLGYHYARSYKTRMLCKNTFNRFLDTYGHLTDEINNNLYAIPDNESIIDFETYLKIFDDFSHKQYTSNMLKNIAGCICVNERYINPQKSKLFFQQKLQDFLHVETITDKQLLHLSEDYDLVINCTNNFLNPDTNKTFWELCVMLVYEKKQPVDFGALTLVDGSLFSIYPYLNNTVTLSHVVYTPVSRRYVPMFDDVDIDIGRIKQSMESDVIKYFPNFNDHFRYCDYFTSIKIKRDIKSDDRSPVCYSTNNVVSCYTGKIQGVFFIEQFVKNEISNRQ